MTDETRGAGGELAGPPWSVDTLADLHAGVLDERTSQQLWQQVEGDPEARAVLDALDATTNDLASLAGAATAPMPEDVATRIDTALANEADRFAREQGSNVVSIDTARRRRNRRFGWAGAAVTTIAAAVAAVAIIGLPGTGTEPGSPNVAQPPVASDSAGNGPVALQEGNLGSAIGSLSGVRDFGPLGSEARLDACLSANDIDPDVKPAGITPGTYEGEQAVFVLYPTGNLAQFRLIALPTTCGPDNPGLLVDRVVGKGSGN